MKTHNPRLGRPPGGIMMLILTCAAMGANGATIVQTQDFSFPPYASRTLTFEKFNNNGGNATLTGAHITIQYTRRGGYAAYDNESESTATITLTNKVTQRIDTQEILALTEMGSSSRLGGTTGLSATSPTSATLGVDDDPTDSDFNSSGADYFQYNTPKLAVSDSASMNNIARFNGTDSIKMELEGTQGGQSQLMSGLKSPISPPSATGSITITYDYTGDLAPVQKPYPTAAFCATVIWALFIRRRLH